MRIHLTDKEHKNLGYIMPIKTTPPAPPANKVLSADFEAEAERLEGELGCMLRITFDAWDLTGGNIPVTNVVLKVNGEMWHDSGGISTEHYQNTVLIDVSCGETFEIEVTATNANGQTVISTGPVTTPE